MSDVPALVPADAALDGRRRADRGHGPAGRPALTGRRIVASEWTKLWSLRSSRYSLVAAFVMLVGLSLLLTSVWVHNVGDAPVSDFWDPTAKSMQGGYLAQLAVGALGVLAFSGEYGTGMIRATMTAVPRRLPVLWAKLAVFAAAVFAVSIAAALVAFLAGQAVLAQRDAGAGLGDPGVVRALLGAALYLTAIALLGLGLGAALRSTAAALSVLLGLLLVVPTVVSALPSTWSDRIEPYLVIDAGDALIRAVHEPDVGSPGHALLVLAGYVVVAVAAGAVVLSRRDV